MGPAVGTLSIVALFGAAGLVMRALAQREARLATLPPDSAGLPLEPLAVTADGQRFLLQDDGVRILPAGDLRALWPVRGRWGLDWNQLMFQRSSAVDPRTHAPQASWVPGTRLIAGDLVGARMLAPDDPHLPPWRVEALGRDRDYRVWEFSDEHDARAALGMLAHRVVRRPWFDRAPWPPQAADYVRALEQRIATEQQLTTADAGWTWSASPRGPWFTR